jgi:hypothetical protein
MQHGALEVSSIRNLDDLTVLVSEVGANIFIKTFDGHTVLHAAAMCSNPRVMRGLWSLLQGYPDMFREFVRERTNDRITALHSAIRHGIPGHFKLICRFFDLEATVTISGKALSYLDYAVHFNKPAHLEYLVLFPFSARQFDDALSYSDKKGRRECFGVIASAAMKRGLLVVRIIRD